MDWISNNYGTGKIAVLTSEVTVSLIERARNTMALLNFNPVSEELLTVLRSFDYHTFWVLI